MILRLSSGCWCYLLGRVSVRSLAPIMILLTFLVIILGGTIRIYDAGESCPDWPQCFGTWGFDVSQEDQGIWYDETEEYDSRGPDHRYTTFEIFIEWIHRLLASLMAIPVLANFLIILKSKLQPGHPFLQGLKK